MLSAKRLDSRLLPYVFLLGAILLIALEMKSLAGHVGSDFRIFHNAALRFSTSALDLYTEGSARSLQGFLYPPPAIILFLPFTALPLATSYAVFSVCLYLSALLSMAIWAKLSLVDGTGCATSRFSLAVIMLFALASGPLFAAVAAGQVDILVLFLCVAAIALNEKGRPVLGGLVLALGFWIKIYPVALLAYAFFRPGSYRMLIGFLSGLVIVPFVSAAIVPVELYRSYFLELLPQLSGRTIVNIYNQSLTAFFVRLDLPLSASTDSFLAYPVADSIRRSITLGAVILIAGITALARFAKHPVMPSVAVVLALFPIIAPLGWGHTYVYILPLLYSTWLMGRQARSKLVAILVVAMYLVLLVPAYRIIPLPPGVPESLHKIVYARYLCTTIFLLAMAALLMRVNLVNWRSRHGAAIDKAVAAS